MKDRIIFKRDQSQQKFNVQKITEPISMPFVFLSIKNVSGWSENVLSVSINNLAGIAIFPSSFASAFLILVFIVVSKSEAEIASVFADISSIEVTKGTNAIVLVRSTVLPGTTRKLSENFSNPEDIAKKYFEVILDSTN